MQSEVGFKLLIQWCTVLQPSEIYRNYIEYLLRFVYVNKYTLFEKHLLCSGFILHLKVRENIVHKF